MSEKSPMSKLATHINGKNTKISGLSAGPRRVQARALSSCLIGHTNQSRCRCHKHRSTELTHRKWIHLIQCKEKHTIVVTNRYANSTKKLLDDVAVSIAVHGAKSPVTQHQGEIAKVLKKLIQKAIRRFSL